MKKGRAQRSSQSGCPTTRPNLTNALRIDIEDPATGEIIAKCHAASVADIDDAVQLAHRTFKSGVWSKAPRHVRADVLDKCAELLTADLPRLIELEVRQTGRAIREMKAQVPTLVKWFKYCTRLGLKCAFQADDE